MPEPTLSICVPSRNRQIYFQEAIKSLLVSTRDDVEFVFSDNSDDPSIMDGFMQAFAGDRRIRYLPSAEMTLSMMDNWERTLAAATGRFVAFIGDDDYIDPELAGFIVNLERKIDVDAIAWTGPNYIWPTEGSKPRSISISLKTDVTQFARRHLLRKAFLWEGCSHVPLSGFSIYHGALSRKLLDRVRLMGNGRYFEFPVIDYEMAFKAIMLGETFIHVARPFSILGACPLSNSVTIGNVEAEKKGQEIFFKELGRDMNHDAWMESTPFRTWHGITACIYLIQHWLSHKYGLAHEGYEQNLMSAFAANCGLFRDRESFDLVAGRYREAIAGWKGGRYLGDFNPVFTSRGQQSDGPRFRGLKPNSTLVFPDDIGGVRTPGALFHLFESLLVRPGEIDIDLAHSTGEEAVIAEAEAA
jgi:glycosyltransferase involved in cell wall biosynthesis